MAVKHQRKKTTISALGQALLQSNVGLTWLVTINSQSPTGSYSVQSSLRINGVAAVRVNTINTTVCRIDYSR
jgi:hypothetical protein